MKNYRYRSRAGGAYARITVTHQMRKARRTTPPAPVLWISTDTVVTEAAPSEPFLVVLHVSFWPVIPVRHPITICIQEYVERQVTG